MRWLAGHSASTVRKEKVTDGGLSLLSASHSLQVLRQWAYVDHSHAGCDGGGQF